MAMINISENEPIYEFKESIISISKTNKSLYNHNEDGLHQSIISIKQKDKDVNELHDLDQEQKQQDNKNAQGKIFEFSQGLPTFRSQSNDFSQSNRNIVNVQQVEVSNTDQQDISNNLQINLFECNDSFSTQQQNFTNQNSIQDNQKSEFQNTTIFKITKKVNIENQNRLRAVTFTNHDFTEQVLENQQNQQQNEIILKVDEQDSNQNIIFKQLKNDINQSKSLSQLLPAVENHIILNNDYNHTFFVESPNLKEIQVTHMNEENDSFENTDQNLIENKNQIKFDIQKQNLDIFRQQSVNLIKHDDRLNLPSNKMVKSNSVRELFLKEYNDQENQYFFNNKEEKQQTEFSNQNESIQIQKVQKFKQNRRQFMRTHQNIQEILRSPIENIKPNQFVTRTVRSSNIEQDGQSSFKQDLQDQFIQFQEEEIFQYNNILDQNNDKFNIQTIEQRIQQISPIDKHNFQNKESQYLQSEGLISAQKQQYNEIVPENQSCPENFERNSEKVELIRQYTMQDRTQSLQKQFQEEININDDILPQVENDKVKKMRVNSDQLFYQNQSESNVIEKDINYSKDLEVTIIDVMNINNNSASPKTNQTMGDQQQIKLKPYIEPQILRKSNLFQHNSYQSDDQQQIHEIIDQDVENLQDIQSMISNNLIKPVDQVELRKINYSANNENIQDKIDDQNDEVIAQQLIRKANSLYKIEQLSPEKLIFNANHLIEQQQSLPNQSVNDKIQTNQIIDQNASSEEANNQNYLKKKFYIQKSQIPFQFNEDDNSTTENNIRQNKIELINFDIQNNEETSNINASDGFIKFDVKKYPLGSKTTINQDQISIQKGIVKEQLHKKYQEDQEFQKQQSFKNEEIIQKINHSFDIQNSVQKYNSKKINNSQYLTGEKNIKQEINLPRKKVDTYKTGLRKEVYDENIDEKFSESEMQSLRSKDKLSNNYIKHENQKMRKNIPYIDSFNQDMNNQEIFGNNSNIQNDYFQFQSFNRDIQSQNDNIGVQQNIRRQQNMKQNNHKSFNNFNNTPSFDNHQQMRHQDYKSNNMFKPFQKQEQYQDQANFNAPFEQKSDQQLFQQFQIFKSFMNQKQQYNQSRIDPQNIGSFYNNGCQCQNQMNYHIPTQNYNNFQSIQNQQQYNQDQSILSQMKNATINQINMNINYLKYIEQKEFQLKQNQEYQEFMEFQNYINRHK